MKSAGSLLGGCNIIQEVEDGFLAMDLSVYTNICISNLNYYTSDSKFEQISLDGSSVLL